MRTDRPSEGDFVELSATSSRGLYRALCKDSHDIRLLLLLPGVFNEEIECLIRHASLDEKDLHYETISYVWGDPSFRIPIKVDGQVVEVTKNLGDALRHLRLPDKPLTLWADAICINQKDLTEKMHQVGMMRSIYSGCAQNYIWLGCDKSENDNTVGDDNQPQGKFLSFELILSTNSSYVLSPFEASRS